MQRLLKIAGRWMLALAALILAVYVCEDLVLRYRAGHGGASAVFDRVTTYEAGEVKGGKLEYYFDQPGVEVCVRAMFPHFGDAPCWYARRHSMKVLSQSGPDATEFRGREARSWTLSGWLCEACGTRGTWPRIRRGDARSWRDVLPGPESRMPRESA